MFWIPPGAYGERGMSEQPTEDQQFEALKKEFTERKNRFLQMRRGGAQFFSEVQAELLADAKADEAMAQRLCNSEKCDAETATRILT